MHLKNAEPLTLNNGNMEISYSVQLCISLSIHPSKTIDLSFKYNIHTYSVHCFQITLKFHIHIFGIFLFDLGKKKYFSSDFSFFREFFLAQDVS